MNYRSSVLELIGNTPMVRINKLNPNKNALLLAKLEKYNPTGSVKDRAVKYMIQQAEKNGELNGKTLLEATSGNTGIAMAALAAVKEYKIDLVMPSNMSVERKKILKAFGANLIGTPAEKGMDGAIELAEKLSKKEKYFKPDQFKNQANTLAHYETTGEEIWRDTDGQITHFIAGVGTSGTIVGVSKKLKEKNPDVKVIGAQPYPGGRIQGLKNLETQRVPEIYDSKYVDETVYVRDEEAFQTARDLARKEGLLMGMSSGAAMHAAIKTAEKISEGIIVVLLPDGGEKYLSTPLYE